MEKLNIVMYAEYNYKKTSAFQIVPICDGATKVVCIHL